DAAIASLNETLDISRADLDTLLRQVEQQALLRQRGDLTSADIMSRDVVTVARDATADEARSLLLDHDIRTLPVLDADRRLLGTVGCGNWPPWRRTPICPSPRRRPPAPRTRPSA